MPDPCFSPKRTQPTLPRRQGSAPAIPLQWKAHQNTHRHATVRKEFGSAGGALQKKQTNAVAPPAKPLWPCPAAASPSGASPAGKKPWNQGSAYCEASSLYETRLCGPHNRREARTTLTIMARMRIKTFQSVALEDVFAVLRTFIMQPDRFPARCRKTYRSNSGRKIS